MDFGKELLVGFEGDLCLSGGADGADLQWGMTAGSAGHDVIHWSFKEHNTHAPPQEIVRLADDTLEEGLEMVKRAAKRMGKNVPIKTYIRKLILRNYFQIRDASSLYAVGKFKKSEVDGGTAWAVEMFKERMEEDFSLKMFVFDQTKNVWKEYTVQDGWKIIDIPPKPSGIWAGIGTRDLSISGKEAIRKLMGWKKP